MAGTLNLLGGFELRDQGRLVDVPQAAHRILGFLALNDRRMSRTYLADSLWPDTEESKACANLRTTLWRLQRTGCRVLVVSRGDVALDPSLRVDVQVLREAARQYRREAVLPDPEFLLGIRGELLPECWDSWVVFDRERLRQESIELLEAASQAARSRGDTHLALLLGLRAVECDPLRESANLLVVGTHLSRNDVPSAVRQARVYAKLLDDEIGVGPPQLLVDLLSSHRPARDGRAGRPAALAAAGREMSR